MTVSATDIWQDFSSRLKSFILGRVRDEHDAEDILQDVFLKVHRNLHNLRDEDKLKVWVYQITRNAVYDYYRQRKVVVDPVQQLESWAQDPVPDNVTDEVASCLRPMLDALPEIYREAIVLTEFEGLTQKAMAQKLDLSLPGAKARVQRGRKKLEEMLLGCCHFEFDRRGNILAVQPKEESCRYCGCDTAGE
jgi:RNA polymerase sigma-70 factor (ECF subfamily)